MAEKESATAQEQSNKAEPHVVCQTPISGSQPTRVVKWKYDMVRKAILANVPCDDVGIMFKQLPSLVRCYLSKEDRERLGSITWHTTTVKLDLEARGQIERIAGARPQYLRRVM